MYQPDYCKTMAYKYIVRGSEDALSLILSRNYVCGYLFNFCQTTSTPKKPLYQKKTMAEWDTYVAKSNTNSPNNLLDLKYDGTTSQCFKILTLNDVNLDWNYVAGSSKSCNELACCEAAQKSSGSNDQAGTYGEGNCHLSKEGFTKFIEGIETKMGTSPCSPGTDTGVITNVLFTGGSIADLLTSTETNQKDAFKHIVSTLKAKFPKAGIFVSMGINDVYPI